MSEFDEQIEKYIDSMKKTMDDASPSNYGVGLQIPIPYSEMVAAIRELTASSYGERWRFYIMPKEEINAALPTGVTINTATEVIAMRKSNEVVDGRS